MRKFILCVGALCALAACGGGSGGGSNLSVSFSPNSLSGSVYQGESESFPVTATVNGSASGNVFVGIIDEGGAFESPITLQQQGSKTFLSSLKVSSQLDPREYSSDLKVLLCSDAGCQHQISSSSLPYDIKVLSNTNLTPLAKLDGASDWTTAQGNAAHTGYVPATLDPTKFSSRWVLPVLEDVGQSFSVPQISTSNGKAYISTATSIFPVFALDAINESDGSIAWSTELGQFEMLGQPTVSGDGIYVTSATALSNTQQGTSDYSGTFSALNIADGTIKYQVKFTPALIYSQALGAPAVAGTSAFVSGGNQFGLQALNTADGSPIWQRTDGCFADSATAVLDDLVYCAGSPDGTGRTSGLRALTRAGVADYQVPVSDSSYVGAFMPVLSGGNPNVILADYSSLSSVSNSSKALSWSVPGNFSGVPATAKGVIYVLSLAPYQLQARSDTDGHLLWSWTPDATESGFYGNLVVTDNMVFVSTAQKVHAVDFGTHASPWSYPHPGRLAISGNGILYISRMEPNRSPVQPIESDGYITAINLH